MSATEKKAPPAAPEKKEEKEENKTEIQNVIEEDDEFEEFAEEGEFAYGKQRTRARRPLARSLSPPVV